MGAFVLPLMFLTLVGLVIATTLMTFRDHKREKAEELKAAREAGALSETGLETSRYRSGPRR